MVKLVLYKNLENIIMHDEDLKDRMILMAETAIFSIIVRESDEALYKAVFGDDMPTDMSDAEEKVCDLFELIDRREYESPMWESMAVEELMIRFANSDGVENMIRANEKILLKRMPEFLSEIADYALYFSEEGARH